MNGLNLRASGGRIHCLAAALAASLFAFSTVEATAGLVNFGPANDYNVFVFGDMSMSNTDAEGRIVVGGNATFTNYTIGMNIGSAGTIPVVVVGGNYSNSQATVNGPVFVGNNLTHVNPTINGNLAVNGNVTFSNWGTLNNSKFTYGGTLTNPNTTFNSVVSNTGTTTSPIDFAAAEAYLKAESALLDSLSATGTTTVAWGGITLNATTNDLLQIFDVSGTALSSANNLVINAKPGQTVVVNIDGSIDTFRYFGISINGTTRQNVVYNFTQATNLQIAGINIEGSILAPFAAVDFSNGQFNGTLVAKSLSGGGQFNHALFTGNLPTPPEPSTSTTLSNPEPASLALWSVGALIFGARRWRKRSHGN